MSHDRLSTLRNLVKTQSIVVGCQILNLTAYPLLVSSRHTSDPEGIFKGIDAQRKDTLAILLALFAIQVNFEDNVDAFITFALASLTLTLRLYLEGVPLTIIQNRVNAMGLRTFSVINAIPPWGTVLVSAWMIGRFIPHPLLTLAAIITAVVTSICIRAIWAKVVNLRGSMGRVEGARDGSSAV